MYLMPLPSRNMPVNNAVRRHSGPEIAIRSFQMSSGRNDIVRTKIIYPSVLLDNGSVYFRCYRPGNKK
ncbi:hypothetical protein CFIMG_007371RA00001 [Ceratocystis fimbriata CBS 114723]|uniref:Uncharacterized protein n=1 Tax=Ceratocystis fimbriata CBS 114723 TaxID=1035309 RepID=A0A2C5WYE3_9PEZI|nr:hypothetical protein CFIMG_007371RA00001 [Ceratocystis fimbriata CBS 114723]